MENKKSYLKIAFSPELAGRDRLIYRALEIFPGALAWGTLSGMFLASYFIPVYAAFFIIIFDLYWLVKTVFLSLHLRANAGRMKMHLGTDWAERLRRLRAEHVWHLVVFPMANESREVVKSSVEAILKSAWPKERMIIALSYEERYGGHGREVAEKILAEFGSSLPNIFSTMHSAGLEGEIPGKGGNETWAAREAKRIFIDPRKIPYENIIVSSFDIDTQIYPQYFECLAWHFLAAKNPVQASYQPVPVFNNNIWAAPALSRVVATSGTFWQMMQQERPERMVTFSSHSMSFKTLVDLDFWQTNIVSEDSRIFWNSLLFYDGRYESIPLSYPVSMDANLAPTFWRTVKNVYRQQRRWAWGVENFPYVAFGFLKNKKIPFRTKAYYIFNMVEGYWSWSTNALLLFALGWLPVFLGGREFNTLVLAYNLPTITRTIMTFAMVGLVTSAIISMQLLPPRPPHYGKLRTMSMVLQWILVPFTIIAFGAIPALDAQTRLMLGKYMGFWITPKHRK
ncbi:MAG: glycosyltransferase family 2 protein [Candidatus Giovannonibacteria bacterium]|nr:MAG: glycosyltransferase family 2 protein [Candidatus Giovannonibacteria bacterium]